MTLFWLGVVVGIYAQSILCALAAVASLLREQT